MKNFIKFIFLLLALLGTATPALAHNFEVDGIYYNINGAEVTVTYKGTYYNQYSNEYTGTVTIPSTVTYSGTGKTYTVTTIGSEAFRGCSGLASVTIPNSVTNINYDAFYGCSGLTNVTIGNSVKEIGYEAFSGCTNLTSVSIPKSVISIGDAAFSRCCSLTSITVNSGNTVYDSRNNCNAIIGTASNTLLHGCMNSIIPNTVTSIGASAFNGCSGMTKVTIPNTIMTIGSKAFYGCSGLTSLTIPNSVISVGSEAFRGCNGLTSLTIPNSVTAIDNGVFAGCTGLTGELNIPNSVTTIGSEAFFGCFGLTNVTIPNSVKEIGGAAFRDCSGLKDLYLGDSVQIISNAAFYNCDRLKNVTIPESVRALRNLSFGECDSLSTVTWNAITCEGYDYDENTYYWVEYPFGLNSINHFTFGENVTHIPGGLFTNCHNVTSITWNVKSYYIENYSDGPFYDRDDEDACLFNLKYVTIGDSVKAIPNSLFAHCTKLTDVYSYISDPSAITMGSNVFYRNSNLTLHVPIGSVAAYQADTKWSQYFGSIVEMDPVLATLIELNQSNAEVNVGENLQLTATVLPEDATDKMVSWITSNENVATVNENGLVTAVAPGSATITAMTNDGSNLSASCDVTVLQGILPAESIQLNVTTAGLNEGATLQLTATVLPEECDNKTVLWASNNPSVATVDSNGLVTTHSVGTATITAMTTDGSNLSTTCTVTLLPVGVKGDVNGDTLIDISDVTKLIDYLLSGIWN